MIRTRYRGRGRCDAGHRVAMFDLIIAGAVHVDAATLHQVEDRQDVYFDPPALREWIEADHDRLHAVGDALADAWGAVRP